MNVYPHSNWFFEHWISGELTERTREVLEEDQPEPKAKQKDLSVWFFIIFPIILLLVLTLCAKVLKDPSLVIITFLFAVLVIIVATISVLLFIEKLSQRYSFKLFKQLIQKLGFGGIMKAIANILKK